MRALILCVGLSLVSLSLLISVARGLGALHPSPVALLFTQPDGTACPQACLLGVSPGVMSVRQAAAVVANHPFTRGFTRLGVGPTVYFQQTNSPLLIIISSPTSFENDERISITIEYQDRKPGESTSDDLLILGDLVSWLGPPRSPILDQVDRSGVASGIRCVGLAIDADPLARNTFNLITPELSTDDLCSRLNVPLRSLSLSSSGTAPLTYNWRGFGVWRDSATPKS